MAVKPLYRRVLLKVSGEALMGEQPYGIDPAVIDWIARRSYSPRLGVEVALVVGGGNIFRGCLPALRMASSAQLLTIWACWRR